MGRPEMPRNDAVHVLWLCFGLSPRLMDLRAHCITPNTMALTLGRWSTKVNAFPGLMIIEAIVSHFKK